MKTKILPIAFLVLITLTNYAQSTFEKIIQTDASAKGSARSVIKTKDGGFAVAGYSFLNNVLSSHFLKFSADGKIQWQKTFNRISGGSVLNTCIQTKDNGYALLGVEQGTGASGSSVIKLDNAGNILWYKQFNGEYAPGGVSIAETTDSSLVIGGTTSYLSTYTGTWEGAYCAFKINATGSLLWNKVFKRYYQDVNDQCLNMIKTTDDEFILCGYGNEHDVRTSEFIKFNADGELLWEKGFNGGSFYTRHYESMIQLKDTIIAFGWGPDSGEEFYGFQVLKLDNNNGSFISAKKRNYDPYHQLAGSKACIKTADGGYIIVGGQTSPWLTGGYGPIIKYDENFNMIWGEAFYDDNFYPTVYSITELNDGSLIAVGELNEKIFVGKLLPDGGYCRQLNTYDGALSDFTDSNGNSLLTITENMSSADLSYILAADVKVYTKCNTVLPLQLLSFSTKRNGKTNLLQWSTTQELNTDRFEIQRSSNSRDFISIGTVRTFNNGKSKNDYAYTDQLPLKATNYYRLKMIDKDGKFTYSAIKSVNNNGSFDVSVYPNPVKNILSLNFNTEKITAIQIEIVNTDGKKLQTKKVQLPYGNSIQTMNVAALSKGTYFVQCITKDANTSIKFVKE